MAGKAKVGGIDFNKARMRRVAEAVLALSWRPNGFTSSELADQVTQPSPATSDDYSPRQAAYDLKKLRGKQMVDVGQYLHQSHCHSSYLTRQTCSKQLVEGIAA